MQPDGIIDDKGRRPRKRTWPEMRVWLHIWWRAQFNSVRASFGLRRLPELMERDFLPPRTDPLEDDEEPAIVNLSRRHLAAVLAFAIVAVASIWLYGTVTRAGNRGAENVLAAHGVLQQALSSIEEGDIDSARRIRAQASGRVRDAAGLRMLDGYIMAASGDDEAAVGKKLAITWWSRSRSAMDRVNLAGYREHRGDIPGALQALDEASHLRPNDAGIWMLRAGMLLRSGQPAKAIEAADRVAQSIGPNLLSMNVRGRAYLDLDRPQLAAHEFRAATMYPVRTASSYLGLIEALTRLGETRELAVQTNAALLEYPKVAEFHARMGYVLEQAGDPARAEQAYRAAIERDPEHAYALNNLACLLAVERKKPADALKFAQRAVAVSPDDPGILDTLGWVHHLMGNDGEAAKHLRKALDVAPNDEAVKKHLAAVSGASS